MNPVKPRPGIPTYADFEGLKRLATRQTDIHGPRTETLKPRFYTELTHGHETMAT